MADIDNFPFQLLARFLTEGSVVPFLGAGVNLCDRPDGVKYAPGGKYLPSGWELTEILAQDFFYPEKETLEIMRVAEFVAVAGGGPAELYKALRSTFNADYPATTIHQAIAALPAALAAKGYEANHQLIVTTNYDDVMERAFAEAGAPYDVVVYVMDEDQQGQLMHISDGKSRPIRSNQDTGLPFEIAKDGQLGDFRLTRSLILKVHGAIDRQDASKDSYVITEDNYVDYLARRDITKLLPKYLLYKLTRSHLLFLGYSITDWNLRVVLNRLWSQRKPNEVSDSWAIQREPKQLDVQYWQRKGVALSNIPLADFATAIDAAIQSLKPAA